MRPSRWVGVGGGGGSGGVFTNYVRSLNFRTIRFMYWGGSHVPVDILLLYNIMRLPSSLSQFRSIFLLLICHRFTCVIWLFQSHDVCRNFTLTGPRWWQGVFFYFLLCLFSPAPSLLQCKVCTANNGFTCKRDSSHDLETCRPDQHLCITYEFLALGTTTRFERRCSTLEEYKNLIDACYSPPPAGLVVDSACFVAHCNNDGCKADIQH